VILILADDLGWKDVGYAGAEFFETPNIDKLAAQGMKFDSAYSGRPNCSPTRGCLMSGTYTPRHHIYTPGGRSKGKTAYMRLLVPARGLKKKNLAAKAEAQFPVSNSLNPSYVCIPEVLKPAGYATTRLGKWHLGNDTQGFDVSSSDGKRGPNGDCYGVVGVTKQLTDRALRFIETNRERPFFVYLSFWHVHAPHQAAPHAVAKYQSKLNNIPRERRRNFDPAYAAQVEAVDISVGRVMAKVDELGLGKNTLIIFTSDNGGTSRCSQLAPLRGEKGSLFEAGVRVPACMRWTGAIQPNSICHTPITSVDFLPTFASLASATLPTSQPADGVDLSPLLRGKPIAERSIFWHYPLYLEGEGLTIHLPGGKTYSWRGVPAASLRRSDWKLIKFFEDDSVALYNLKDDPGEKKDLSQAMPAQAAALRKELEAWIANTQAPVPKQRNPECVLESNTRPPRAEKARRQRESGRTNETNHPHAAAGDWAGNPWHGGRARPAGQT